MDLSTRDASRAPWRRGTAVLLCVTVAALGCVSGNAPLDPRAGVRTHEDPMRIGFGGFEVNAAGGNLLVRRTDFSIDTRLGTLELGATYNSAERAWRWTHELEFAGSEFIDASGAATAVGVVAPGERIPGSRWVLVDGDTLRTLGGLEHHFDSAGKLAFVHWQHDAYPRLVFSDAGIDQCTGATSCEPVFAFGRDAEGRIVAVDDRAGRHADYAWNERDELETARDPLSVETGRPGTRYEYAGLFPGRMNALVDPDDRRFEIEIGLWSGRVASVREPGTPAPTVRFHYERDADTGANVTRVTNALGAPCIFHFDDLGRPTRVENAIGDVRHFAWDGFEKSLEIAPDGAMTSWARGQGWESETTPSGNVVTTTYASGVSHREAPFDPPVLVRSDTVGIVEERDYDASGRLVALRDGVGTEVAWTYHPDGSVATRTSPSGDVVQFSDYGEHGHARLVEHQGELVDPTWVVPPVYDDIGNLVEGPQLAAPNDPGRPGIVRRHFDAHRRIVRLELGAQRPAEGPTGLFLEYASDELLVERRHDGQIERVLRPYGADSEFDYDAAGRLVRRRDRVDGAWVVAVEIAYDAAGSPLRVERANGFAEETDYDVQNRPVQRRLLRGAVIEQTVAYQYVDGHLVEVHDSEHGAAERIVRDASGRPVWTEYPGGEVLEQLRDARGREVTRRYWMSDGGQLTLLRELSRVWNDADQQRQLFDGTTLVYDVDIVEGRVAELRSGNGLRRTFTRDALGRVEKTESMDAQGGYVEDTYVDRWNCLWTTVSCTSVASWVAGAGSGEALERTWLDSGQFPSLIPASAAGARVLAWSRGPGPRQRWYRWDFNGNLEGLGLPGTGGASGIVIPVAWNADRTRMLSLPQGTWSSDPQTGEAIASSAISYAYDAAGFVIDRNGTPISWTPEGRVASIGADTFRWAFGGRPIERTLAGETLRFLFDGSVMADASGAPHTLRASDAIDIDLATGERMYRYFDSRGNVRFAADDAGQPVAHYEYEPGGAVRDRVAEFSGVSAGDRVRFGSGIHLDDGLILMGDRVLDPFALRFLSPDPLAQLSSQYAYTNGNPAWLRDFDGRLAVPHPFDTSSLEVPVALEIEFDGPNLPSQALARLAISLAQAAESIENKTARTVVRVVAAVTGLVAALLAALGLEIHSDGPRRMRRRFGIAPDPCEGGAPLLGTGASGC